MSFRHYCCDMFLKRALLFALILSTVINGFIFFYRDLFAYQPYSSYSSLYGPCNSNCKEKWHQFVDDYSEIEQQQAKQITDSIVSGDIATIDKVTSIAKFLYDRFYKQIGIPSIQLSTSSPLNQYKTLCSSKNEQLWCGNFAVMMTFFCWSQGIVTRNIEIMHPGNHHVLNECYIPETKSWVVTDPTNNIFCIKDKTGNYLNFVALRGSLKKRSELVAMESTNGSIEMKSLKVNDSKLPVQYTSDDPCHFYYHIDGSKIYKTSNKIERYILPRTWYEIYDNDKRHSNIPFYLKQLFGSLWIITSFVFLITLTKFKL